MPLATLIGLVCIFAMFGSFIVGVGGVSLWVALGDRKRPQPAPQVQRTPTRPRGLRQTRTGSVQA